MLSKSQKFKITPKLEFFYSAAYFPHITGLPGIWFSVFTASPDVSDFFYRKLVKNAKLAIFGDIQVQIWHLCENLVILVL